jgi:hypothetical protein
MSYRYRYDIQRQGPRGRCVNYGTSILFGEPRVIASIVPRPAATKNAPTRITISGSSKSVGVSTTKADASPPPFTIIHPFCAGGHVLGGSSWLGVCGAIGRGLIWNVQQATASLGPTTRKKTTIIIEVINVGERVLSKHGRPGRRSSSFPKKQYRRHHSPNNSRSCCRRGQLSDNRWRTKLGEAIDQNSHQNDYDAPVVVPASTVTDHQWTAIPEFVARKLTNHHVFQLPFPSMTRSTPKSTKALLLMSTHHHLAKTLHSSTIRALSTLSSTINTRKETIFRQAMKTLLTWTYRWIVSSSEWAAISTLRWLISVSDTNNLEPSLRSETKTFICQISTLVHMRIAGGSREAG